MYDFLIVGAGLFGSICARELTDAGYKCLVIDKRDHIGGNCYTENVDGINVHKYGAHIFHTSDKRIWDYMNKYTTFNHFVNRPKVRYGNDIYSFPVNLMTLYQIYGVGNPIDAMEKLYKVRPKIEKPNNLEEWALSQVGPDIYDKFIKGYTAKQWGRDPKDLPASIIRRLPIRLNFDDNYFNDIYQGIPIGGYTAIFNKLLEGIDVELGMDFFKSQQYWEEVADRIIYTGPIDRYYDYMHGHLEYRSLRFETERIDTPDLQGNAVINYTHSSIPYTRIIEHKHFEFGTQPFTIVTTEFPSSNGEPYYPVNDEHNNNIYNRYKSIKNDKVIFGGRLADYKYYDMHQVVGAALKCVKTILSSRP